MGAQSRRDHEQNMSYFEFLDRELFSHQKAGGFRPNSLFTRLVSDADLHPIDREPYPLALPLHIHEYIHYLHNISTPTGISFLLNEINSIYEFLKGTNEKGVYLGRPNDLSLEKIIARNRKIMYGGGEGEAPPSGIKIAAWSFSSPTATVEERVLQENDIHVASNVSIAVSAKAAQGNTYNFRIDIGFYFITEGIAYEIDREIRRRLDVWIDLDESTPAFPYLAYQPLIESLLGRKSTLHERIMLGTCALLSQTPGEGLIKACNILKHRSTDSAEFVAYFIDLKLGLESFSRRLTTSVLPTLKKLVRGSPEFERGLEIYFDIIGRAIEVRTKFPFMELGFRNINSVDGFYRAIAEISPQWICQEKEGGSSSIHWIGNHEAVSKIDETAISVLQSIFHYVQAHRSGDGLFTTTSELKGLKCPFFGACQVQRVNDSPAMCGTKPWALELNLSGDLKNPVCFYNAGVRSLYFEKN